MLSLLKKTITLFSFAAFLSLAACAPQQIEAQGDDDYADADMGQDPMEGFNRAMFAFNETVDGLLLKPAAQIYVGIVPEVGRTGVKNFLTNLSAPVVFANSLLQGDGQHAFTTFWRFVINSTLGVVGLYDFAGENFGLKERREDFGQTLGAYGAGSGPYIVLPILGPSSGRDVIGRIADFFMDPFNYLFTDAAVIGRAVAVGVDTRSRNLDLVDDIYRTSIDPYATIRSLYLQKREAEVQNKTPVRAVTTTY